MSILSRTNPKRRHKVPDLSKCSTGVDASKVSHMARSLIGEGDIDLVREAMIERYAQVVVAEKDMMGVETSALYRANSRLKVDYAAKEAIMAGQQEIVRMYLYNSIVRQRATLFTEPSQRYEYENESTGEALGEVREDSGANIVAQRWDSYADGMGSCALYVSDAGGRLSYSEIPPSKIWYGFSESILDGDKDRATNTDDLDEATVVVIEIAPAGDKRRFAAWYGPGDEYENGRQCVYCAENWYDIPAVGNPGSVDYSMSISGFAKGATDVANPLTLIAQSQGAQGSPTYPLAILYGDSMQSGLMPTTSSLYDVCAELDLMGSMIIGAAGSGARGMVAFNRGTDTSIPDNVREGMVLMGRDQALAQAGWPASHAKDAMGVINEFARHIAEAHAVPGWLVVADQSGEVPSGVALEIMTMPLTRNRQARIELNKHSVARRFDIERLVINGAVGSAAIPYDDRETWHAGERTWPVDKEQTLRTWQTRINMGESDLADVVMELRSINTHEEALNWLEERKAIRDASEILSPPKPPEGAPVKLSLAERLGGGRKVPPPGTESPAPNPLEKGTKIAPPKGKK